MKTSPIPMLLACVCLLAPSIRADDAPIDPIRGRELMQKSTRGESLTVEEQAYLDRVKRAIRERALGKQPGATPNAGATRAFVANPDDWKSLVPITEMTAP